MSSTILGPMPKRRRKRREDERVNEEISEKRQDVADEFADRRWRWVVADMAAAWRVWKGKGFLFFVSVSGLQVGEEEGGGRERDREGKGRRGF